MNVRLSESSLAEVEGLPHLSLLREATMYLLASAVALGVDFGLSVALIRWVGTPYQVAAAVGFLSGLLTVYALSTSWVFGERAVQSRFQEFLIFSAIGIVGLLLNAFILYLGVTVMKYKFEYAKGMSVAIVFSFNFIMRKALLFTKGKG
jgi:putative flippase GtrA